MMLTLLTFSGVEATYRALKNNVGDAILVADQHPASCQKKCDENYVRSKAQARDIMEQYLIFRAKSKCLIKCSDRKLGCLEVKKNCIRIHEDNINEDEIKIF